MARMIMRRGPTPGQVYELEGEYITLGRGRRNDIIIHDNEVSREHCELVLLDDYYELRDLNSSNGTFVNGQRVTVDGWLLKSDCILEIGDSITLEYQADQVLGGMYEDDVRPVVNPYLVVLVESRDDRPEIYPIHDEIVDIGRELMCTIVIQEPEVSRQHLRLRYTELGYMAEDLGSTNGTFLNGDRMLVPKLLRLNDVIELGTMVRLLYTDDPSKYLADLKTDILPTISHDDETLSRRQIDSSDMLNRINRPTETSDLGLGFEPGALVGYILVAYAREEWASVVAEVFTYLEDRNFRVWVDQYLNQEAGDWQVAYDHVLSECGLLVVVVSRASLETDYVRRSWRYFQGREKPIILFLYDLAEPLPFELRNLPHVEYNPADPEESYLELVAEIMRLG